MDKLLKSILQLVLAIIVSTFLIPIGFVYSLGYGIWMKKRGNRWTAVFRFLFKIIDGFFYAIGHIVYNIAYGLDLIWNSFGEIIEDFITSEDDTTFGDRDITVSASTGKLEYDGKLNKLGKKFSNLLNIVFWQRSHAKDAWLYTEARKNLEENYFDKLR